MKGWSHDDDIEAIFTGGARAPCKVLDHQSDHPSQWAAICSIAEKMACSGETLRKWVRRAEHCDQYGVEAICKVLPIAPSTYRAHAARRSDPRPA